MLSLRISEEAKKCGVNALENHADFRLLSRKVLDSLSEYKERNLYLRGIIPSLGYDSDIVEYALKPRSAGKSKYTFRKMLALATDGITSFSIKPFYYLLYTGLIMLMVSVIMFFDVVISMLLDRHQPGWSSLMLSLWFIGSVLVIGISIIGIYIGKIYIEVKQRPLYTISETVGEV